MGSQHLKRFLCVLFWVSAALFLLSLPALAEPQTITVRQYLVEHPGDSPVEGNYGTTTLPAQSEAGWVTFTVSPSAGSPYVVSRVLNPLGLELSPDQGGNYKFLIDNDPEMSSI